MNNKRILILGHMGMLGSMTKFYFDKKTDYEILTINTRWPEVKFKKEIINIQPDFIVNCIGAIHQKTNNFDVNYELPIWLKEIKNTKVIHPGTDCENDETPYGLSKRKAFDSLTKNQNLNVKIIKCSIIGPELSGHYGLFEWFLKSKEEVEGWNRFYWNGITTLTWAKIANSLISNWSSFDNVTLPFSPCISKYDLLVSIKNVFNKEITINKNAKIEKNKCIEGNYKTDSIEKQLNELKNFVNNKNSIYNIKVHNTTIQ